DVPPLATDRVAGRAGHPRADEDLPPTSGVAALDRRQELGEASRLLGAISIEASDERLGPPAEARRVVLPGPAQGRDRDGPPPPAPRAGRPPAPPPPWAPAKARTL